MQGLTLANYRIDKAASVEKSHARKKLKASAEWSNLTPTEQEWREKDICEQTDVKRTQKKADARKAWVAKHGNTEINIGVLRNAPKEIEGAEIGCVQEVGGQNASDGYIVDDGIDDIDGSQAEESSEIDEDIELTEEDKQDIFERLRGVWVAQHVKAQELLNDLENA